MKRTRHRHQHHRHHKTRGNQASLCIPQPCAFELLFCYGTAEWWDRLVSACEIIQCLSISLTSLRQYLAHMIVLTTPLPSPPSSSPALSIHLWYPCRAFLKDPPCVYRLNPIKLHPSSACRVFDDHGDKDEEVEWEEMSRWDWRWGIIMIVFILNLRPHPFLLPSHLPPLLPGGTCIVLCRLVFGGGICWAVGVWMSFTWDWSDVVIIIAHGGVIVLLCEHQSILLSLSLAFP